MVQPDTRCGRDDLNNFLDFAGEKGLLKKATAASRKVAANVILGILDENEASDLSSVDLDAIISRHRNLAGGKIIPRTLSTYESRTKIAVNDFLEYLKNPSSWQGSRTRTRSPAKASPIEKSKASVPIVERPELSGEHAGSPQPAVPH